MKTYIIDPIHRTLELTANTADDLWLAINDLGICPDFMGSKLTVGWSELTFLSTSNGYWIANHPEGAIHSTLHHGNMQWFRSSENQLFEDDEGNDWYVRDKRWVSEESLEGFEL